MTAPVKAAARRSPFGVAFDVAVFVHKERVDLGLIAPKLTATQRRALASVVRAPVSVWNMGSTTVNVLRKAGYIETRDGMAHATDAGKVANR